MKRMYVTLGIILVLMVWAVSSLGQKLSPAQDSEAEILKRHLEMREEMHKRIRDKLLHGFGPDDDLFKDMEQMFEGMDTLVPTQRMSQFQTQWSDTKEGKLLTIIPKNKDQQLDIKVENGFVTIKGNEQNSSFSSSFNVPMDCDASKVKMDQKDGKILMHFPYKKMPSVRVKPRPDDRIPLPPTDDAVEI